MLDVILIDIVVFFACTVLLVSSGRLSHSHPATVYLVFHALVVTVRTVGIQLGAEPLFTGFPASFQPIRIDELRRAVPLADIALIAMTFGCLRGAQLGRRRIQASSSADGGHPYRPMSGKLVRAVAGVSLLIGIWGVYYLARTSSGQGTGTVGVEQEGLLSSSYVTITFAWAGLGLLALIYWYGYRWWLLVPMGCYLLVAAIQGGLRFRFIIPVILLAQIRLDQRQRRWPSAGVALLGIALLLVFFPLKTIGSLVQEGASAREISDASAAKVAGALTGQSGDLTIFDQFAMTLTQADETESLFLGRPYLSFVTLPIPRFLWSGKPGLADHLEELSTPSRPMNELGQVTTLWGDAYANFWYVGIVLVPYLLGAFLTRFYVIAYRQPYRSVARFAYLLVACNLIQVYRDGLVSLPLFVIVQMLPLTVLVVLHRYGVQRRDEDVTKSHHGATAGALI